MKKAAKLLFLSGVTTNFGMLGSETGKMLHGWHFKILDYISAGYFEFLPKRIS